jgi:hypothetical protein
MSVNKYIVTRIDREEKKDLGIVSTGYFTSMKHKLTH